MCPVYKHATVPRINGGVFRVHYAASRYDRPRGRDVNGKVVFHRNFVEIRLWGLLEEVFPFARLSLVLVLIDGFWTYVVFLSFIVTVIDESIRSYVGCRRTHLPRSVVAISSFPIQWLAWSRSSARTIVEPVLHENKAFFIKLRN